MYFYPGSSGIGGEFGEVDDFTSVEVLRQALAEGMTHIDTAPWYGAGKAETIIGKVKMCHLYLFPGLTGIHSLIRVAIGSLKKYQTCTDTTSYDVYTREKLLAWCRVLKIVETMKFQYFQYGTYKRSK